MSRISCLEASFSRVGGLTASQARQGDRVSATAVLTGGMGCEFTRAGRRVFGTALMVGRASFTFGLVCVNSLGGDDVLWASDRMVLTVDGGKVYVTTTG